MQRSVFAAIKDIILNTSSLVQGGIIGGIAAAVAIYLERPQPDNKSLTSRSITPSQNTAEPRPKSMDEYFLLPREERNMYGVFAGPNGNAKTQFILDLLANNKHLPINYGEVPTTGSCTEKMTRVLCQLFKLQEEQKKYWLHEQISPTPFGEEEAKLSRLIGHILGGAQEYKFQGNSLQPVAIFDKFERLEGCL